MPFFQDAFQIEHDCSDELDCSEAVVAAIAEPTMLAVVSVKSVWLQNRVKANKYQINSMLN